MIGSDADFGTGATQFSGVNCALFRSTPVEFKIRSEEPALAA